MTTDFSQMNLHPQLVQTVAELGYEAPMPIQSAIIPVMITGQDVIGQAQTGTGKTAAFALPMLHNLKPNQSHIQGLVMAPTRELAMQVANAFMDLGRGKTARVLPVYGGQSYREQIYQLRRGVDIVVGTPGRMLDLIDKGVLDLSHVECVVLDEADEMLSMGFVEDIESILAKTPVKRQTALFSATMPAEIRRLAEGYMNNPQSIVIKSEQLTADKIEQRYYLIHSQDKLAAMTRLFEMEDVTSALIFVRTRGASSDLANELTLRGYPAEALNGDLSQEARERTLSRFRQNQIKVLVATDVAARGLDIDDISHVFNFDLPDDPEVYVHRIGRTGRAGKTGIAISLLCPGEILRLRQIEYFARQKIARAHLPTEQDIRASREKRLMDTVTMWLRRGRCLRERELVETLVQQGFDPLDVAAAALKMARSEEKQRPIAAVTEIPDVQPIRTPRSNGYSEQRSGGRSDRSRGSHEAGMVRLTLSAGKAHGVRPNDIVGAIAATANVPGRIIGKISIEDNHTLVDIPEEYVKQVLSKAGEVWIRRQPIHMQRA